MFDSEEKEYVIASPMQGILTKNRKPAENVKIIRTLRWNGNQEEGTKFTFITDEQGSFSLPVHVETLRLSILSQFVASMDLHVKINGKLEFIWINNKFTPEVYAETGGRITNFICDLEAEEISIRTGQSSILTKCRWDNMPVDNNVMERNQ